VISTRRTGLMTISILASLWAPRRGRGPAGGLNKASGVEEMRPIWLLRRSDRRSIIFSICIIMVVPMLVVRPVIWS
jgi:hypothetical protein